MRFELVGRGKKILGKILTGKIKNFNQRCDSVSEPREKKVWVKFLPEKKNGANQPRNPVSGWRPKKNLRETPTAEVFWTKPPRKKKAKSPRAGEKKLRLARWKKKAPGPRYRAATILPYLSSVRGGGWVCRKRRRGRMWVRKKKK